MKIVSKKKVLTGGFLEAGKHICTIESIADATPTGKDKTPWDDVTPQLIVVYKKEDEDGEIIGKLSQWLNLMGYKSKDDYPDGIAPEGYSFMCSPGNSENYLVNDETNKRIQSDEKSEISIDMLSEMIHDAGIEEGTEFANIQEMKNAVLGADIGVKVNVDGKNHYVHYTYSLEEEVVEVEAA